MGSRSTLRVTPVARALSAVGVAVAAVVCAATARAQTAPPGVQRAAPDPRRDPAYYRGRPAVPPPDAAALWVPRVLLAPFRALAEYGLRRPARAALTFAEVHHVPAYVARLFNPYPGLHWNPAFAYRTGFVPTFGAGLTWDDLGVTGHQLEFEGTTGGIDYVELAYRERITLGPLRLGVRASYFDRADQVFYGLGPDSEAFTPARYRRQRRDVSALVDLLASPHAWLETAMTLRADDTSPGRTAPGARAFDQEVQVGDAAQAPGFGPLALLLATATLTLDTRAAPEAVTGARLAVTGTLANDTLAPGARRFVLGEARLDAAFAIFRPGGVLAAALYVADSGALGTAPVPFTYQPMLGGTLHPGFAPGRFVGGSAALVELTLRHPLVGALEGVWLASLGNVFGTHFAGFDPAALTGSFGVAVRTREVSRGRGGFEIGLALGTHRINEGFGVDGGQFVIALHRGL